MRRLRADHVGFWQVRGVRVAPDIYRYFQALVRIGRTNLARARQHVAFAASNRMVAGGGR
jgi:hypothetical protein